MNTTYEKQNKYFFTPVLSCIARFSAAILVITSVLGFFVNPIIAMYHVITHVHVSLIQVIFLELIFFCSYASYPALDVVAKQIEVPRDDKVDSAWKRMLAFVKVIIVIAFYSYLIVAWI